MKLSENSTVSIIIPEVSTTREQFAAQELKKYLQLVFSGITVKISADTARTEMPQILIGGPERNRISACFISQKAFDTLVPGPEGMFLKSYPDTLLLAGSSKNINERERGTLYAVYEFLERYLGCSFAGYFTPNISASQGKQLLLRTL